MNKPLFSTLRLSYSLLSLLVVLSMSSCSNEQNTSITPTAESPPLFTIRLPRNYMLTLRKESNKVSSSSSKTSQDKDATPAARSLQKPEFLKEMEDTLKRRRSQSKLPDPSVTDSVDKQKSREPR